MLQLEIRDRGLRRAHMPQRLVGDVFPVDVVGPAERVARDGLVVIDVAGEEVAAEGLAARTEKGG